MNSQQVVLSMLDVPQRHSVRYHQDALKIAREEEEEEKCFTYFLFLPCILQFKMEIFMENNDNKFPK